MTHPTKSRFRAIFALLGAIAIATGLGAAAVEAGSTRGSTAPALPPAGSTAHAALPPAGTTDKVLVIVAENHSLSQFESGAPYTYGLATSYGLGTNMQAITHPSKPNYADMVFGTNHGLTSDARKRVNNPTIFDNAIAAGRSAKIMAESMGYTRCRISNTGRYLGRHNPWSFSSNTTSRANCLKYDFSYNTHGASDIAAGKLANIEMLIPNSCHDGHDCSLGTFDKWMKTTWARITAGPDWRSGRLTVIVTADEDDRKHANVIPLFVLNPTLSHKVVATKLTLYSINRLLSQFGHTAYMANGSTAPDLASAFGLTVN